MGRATRWLRSLFGIKKDREHKENSNSGNRRENKWSTCACSGRDSKGLCYNPETIPPNLSPAEAAWLQSICTQTEKEQNKHAIAVAAATAAAADAAVAASQAALAVVRLTSHGRGTMSGGGHEMCAAVKIQTVFRGYLARKALRALKGLVKLQALVRGYFVRKQATATLYSMQALIRAQATVRSHKARRVMNKNNNEATRLETGARKSMERFDDSRSEHTALIHSRRLSASFDASINAPNYNDENPKILEIDTGRPTSRSRRTNTSTSDFGDDPPFQALCSPLPCHTPDRLSRPDCRNFNGSDWGLTGEKCRFSTAQSTPRFTNSIGSNYTLITPANSVCAESFFYGNFPNYMVNTESFKAKLRSQSAPKQRPEPSAPKKRLSLNEMVESRSSLSGVRMQRSCSQPQVQEAISFKNAIVSKLGRSSELVESQREAICSRGGGDW